MGLQELKAEVLSVYQQLRNMCGILRQRGKQRSRSSDSLDTTSSSEEPQVNHVKAGLLLDVMQELKGLLHDILRKEAKGSCASCGSDVNDRMKLEIQLHKTQENFERMERDLKKKEDESKAREDEIRELMSKVSQSSLRVVLLVLMRNIVFQLSVTEVQLKAAEEERDTLRSDIENCDASKDVLIKKAWDTRDAAVKRKNNTEIELAKTRIDVMQINSQLMEAIQQKVELSQQLDQVGEEMGEERVLSLNICISVAVRHAGAPGGPDEQEDEGRPGESQVWQ